MVGSHTLQSRADGRSDQLQLVGEEHGKLITQQLGFQRADVRRAVVAMKQILRNAPQRLLVAGGRMMIVMR